MAVAKKRLPPLRIWSRGLINARISIDEKDTLSALIESKLQCFLHICGDKTNYTNRICMHKFYLLVHTGRFIWLRHTNKWSSSRARGGSKHGYKCQKKLRKIHKWQERLRRFWGCFFNNPSCQVEKKMTKLLRHLQYIYIDYRKLVLSQGRTLNQINLL